MPRLPTIKEVKEKEDDIWSTEVEEAFQEALTMFPTKRRIRLSDGKCYGRNYLISQHIRKKCGKLRTAYQIASHLQVLDGKRKTQLEKLRDHLETNYLISPCSYSNTLLGLTDFGAIKFLHVRENQNSENYFTDAITFLSNTFEILPYRQVSGEKLAFLYFLMYIHEPYDCINLFYSNTIFRGFTCVTGINMPAVKLSKLEQYFGEDIFELYSKTPRNAFYAVKSWSNWYYHKDNQSDSIWEATFYSKQLLNVLYKHTWYVKGKLMYETIVDQMEIAEIISDTEKYFLYRIRLQFCADSCTCPKCSKNHGVQHSYIKTFREILNSGDIDLVRTILQNQGRTIILTDIDTKEILLVLAIINDYMPNFTGYQYFRIIP